MDWDGYCFHLQEYNYNDENTKGWMTANAVKGFQQRTEEMRKFAFGMMHILGDENKEGEKFRVVGVWLTRGQDMKCFTMANDECEYYTWTKVEKGDEANMAKVADRLCLGWTKDQSMEDTLIYDLFEFK